MNKEHPWFKFYPADFRSHNGLGLLGLDGRGLCIELLCLMHNGEPCGYLRINGRAPNAKELATLLRVTRPKHVERLLEQLLKVGVFRRADDGTMYSPRMVRDQEKAAVGREFANKRWAGESDKNVRAIGSPNRAPSTQSPESRNQNPESRDQMSELPSLRSVHASKNVSTRPRALSRATGSLIAAGLPKIDVEPDGED
jgi:hypothetical protein